jgi:hypothetical protein
MVAAADNEFWQVLGAVIVCSKVLLQWWYVLLAAGCFWAYTDTSVTSSIILVIRTLSAVANCCWQVVALYTLGCSAAGHAFHV